MPGIAEILSINLRRLRDEQGLRQEDLSEKSGVSLSAIKAYENQRRWPEKPFIIALAKGLDVPESELFKTEMKEDPVNRRARKTVKVLQLLQDADESEIDDVIRLLKSEAKGAESKQRKA